MKLVLQNLFNRFEKQHILALKEPHIYDKKRYNNSDNDLINDVVLIKKDIKESSGGEKRKLRMQLER